MKDIGHKKPSMLALPFYTRQELHAASHEELRRVIASVQGEALAARCDCGFTVGSAEWVRRGH